MRFVITLIAGEPGALTTELANQIGSMLNSGTETGALTMELAGPARTWLGDSRAAAGPTAWLAPGLACDIPFDCEAPLDASTCLRFAALFKLKLGRRPIDVAVQPAGGRRKALFVADLESTIIGQEMLDELAEAIGLRDEVSRITARAMAGELDFAAALRSRVGLLEGLPSSALDEAARRMTLNPGARTLVQTLSAAGVTTALVSGGFSRFAEPIAAACGFDEVAANRLEVAEGRLTGTVAEPLVDREGKLAALERLAAERGVGMQAACAVGDGANDTAMLAAAGLGVAYRGKPAARAAAGVWIDHGDLTALLYLQGYRREEFRDAS